MPERKRLALVELGSNAIRCEIVELRDGISHPLYRRRSPIRLGSEVFANGKISKSKIEAVARACEQFARECRQRGVDEICGIATSAAREASNRTELVEAILERSGIQVEVISGEEECRLLALAVGQVMDLSHGTNLLVDLGGGSVEASLIRDGRVTSSQSHSLGALRFVHDQTRRGGELLAEINGQLRRRGRELEAQLAGARVDRYIAVGGHMDALVDLLAETGRVDRSTGVASIHTADLDTLAIEMAPHDPERLASRHGMSPDRADSIVAAAQSYLWIASLLDARQIWAPGVSLRQGMIVARQGET